MPRSPPPHVDRHDSPLWRWELVTARADLALRPHVLRYQGYRELASGPFARTEVPTPEVHVIVSFGPSVRASRPLTSFVAVPATRHAVVEHDGEQHGIEIRLTPPGARMLLGVPMHELTHRLVDLEDLLGRRARELAERLYEAPDWEARFALLDAELGRRLVDVPPPPPQVAQAWHALVRSGGSAPVESLAAAAGWSRRHLTARFREHVGLPPKAYARILRFRRALALLARPDGPSLGDVALMAGYYDQAHFNRDFREFAACAPGDLLARRLPNGGGYRAP